MQESCDDCDSHLKHLTIAYCKVCDTFSICPAIPCAMKELNLDDSSSMTENDSSPRASTPNGSPPKRKYVLKKKVIWYV